MGLKCRLLSGTASSPNAFRQDQQAGWSMHLYGLLTVGPLVQPTRLLHSTNPAISLTAMPSEPKYVTLSTSMGDVTFELYVDHAPKVRSLSLLSLARVVCSLRPRRRDDRLLLAQGFLTLTSPARGCDATDCQELHWSRQQGLLQRHRLPPDHLRSFLPSLPSLLTSPHPKLTLPAGLASWASRTS